MYKNLFKISAAFLIIAFISGFSFGVAAANGPQYSQANGIVSVQTPSATFSVAGGNNVPAFHIQHNGSNTNYLVKFVDMEEFVDSNGNGQFGQNEAVIGGTTIFPGAGWNFSGFNTTNDTNGNIGMINFNFTHTTAPMINLDNHVNVTAGNQVKFDISVSQYTWKSTNTSAKLAIKMQVAGGNLTAGSNNDLSFGNAFFNTVTSADSNGASIGVTTQISTGSTFYIIIDHFTSNFTLDPLFGVSSSSSTSGSTASSTSSSISASNSASTTGSSNTSSTPGFEVLPFLAGFAVIGLIMTKKRL